MALAQVIASRGAGLSFLDLPNEILIHILCNCNTLALLHLRLVNRRFQQTVTRLLHGRFTYLLTVLLKDRKLILECYHPSAQYSEPYLYCDYIGTPDLQADVQGQESIYDVYKTGLLKRLYCHFRPISRDPRIDEQQPHPAGDIPGSRTSVAAAETDARQARVNGPVKRIINLDAYENFSQLVCNTELVRLGPRKGMILDIMRVTERRTSRIFRQWLIDRAEDAKRQETLPPTHHDWTKRHRRSDTEDDIVWIEERRQSAGLKVRVEERRWRRENPILLHQDDDQAVSFSLELHEVRINTMYLLLAVEQNILEREQKSGQAVIFTTAHVPNQP